MTPAHASWLDQAELLLRAFSERYLKHGNWESRQYLIDHLEAGWREYDRLYAHPFSWSWTRRDLNQMAGSSQNMNLLTNLSNSPLVARRQKHKGMHWSLETSDSLCALKTLMLNHGRELYWQERKVLPLAA